MRLTKKLVDLEVRVDFSGRIGHAFLAVEKYSYFRGFYPDGVKDDTDHNYDKSISIKITFEQFQLLKKEIMHIDEKYTYNMLSTNCAWFVLEALKMASIDTHLKAGPPFPEIPEKVAERRGVIATPGSLYNQM